MKHIFGALAGACLFAPCTFATVPSGNTLYVANNGTDTGACGAASAPCRSISQGIANASAGDTIVVGPGRYGDINWDNALPDYVGEETGTTVPGSNGPVHINKSLTIISSAGAEATVIDAVNSPFANAVVDIAADGVRFGDRNAGFTLLGGNAYGLMSEGSGHTGVVIAGNITRGPAGGISVRSSGVTEVRQNTISGSTGNFGLQAFSGCATCYVIVANNIVTANDAGIAIAGQGPHRVLSNTVAGNQIGFSVNYGPYRFAQNQINNNGFGVFVSGYSSDPITQGPLFTRNNFLGNRASALLVTAGPTGRPAKIKENNFFGNNGCGTNNQTDAPLDARNNYWGSPSGPSFFDPADEACSFLGQPTLTTPFAATEFDVR
jgi:copper-binding protein NosD